MSDPAGLLAAAVAARDGAYAPYSKFPVGAAVADADGNVWTGANVENASYGLSMCAERAAIFHAVGTGRARRLRALAVAGPEGTITLPCGACRQVMWEFAPDLQVIYRGERGVAQISVAELLPAAFDRGRLTEAQRR